MATTTYKGCTITKAKANTTIRRRYGSSLQLHEVYAPLFAISGRYEKPAGLRPFLTSLADAKRWITENDEDRQNRAAVEAAGGWDAVR